MISKLQKFASSLGESLWPIIIDQLKEQTVQFVTKKLLARIAASSTLGAWFATELAERGFEEFVLPTIKAAAVEGGYVVALGEGKYLVRRLKNARTPDEIRDTVDDILS